MSPAIAVEGLVKRYGARTVVSGVSFEVDAGQVVCLLGRNGAGKTTTVECIEGFRSPDAGAVRVLGADPVRDRSAVAHRMGVMLQEGGAYQAATPREMLRLYSGLFPRTRAIAEVLEVTDLTARADDRFRTLSGGEKQRVNLALAIIGCPEVLFLDEPTAGMDPAARRRTWQLVEHLRDDGTAVLLTTHALDEAERLANRIGVLDGGRLLAFGSPEAVRGEQSLEAAFFALIDQPGDGP